MRTLRAALAGVVVTLALLFLKSLIEPWPLGRQIRLMTYDLEQMRLGDVGEPDVVVIDIAPLTPMSILSTITPRQPLLDLVEAIVPEGPCAIGIDVDMSPDENGYRDQFRDPRFFRRMLELWRDTGIPIVLGVDRTIGESPETWLGNEEFAPLAAAIAIPFDTRYMMKFLLRYSPSDTDRTIAGTLNKVRRQAREESDADSSGKLSPSGCRRVPLVDVKDGAAIRSLSYALARGTVPRHGLPRWLRGSWLDWAFEPLALRRLSPESLAWAGEFLVEYGQSLERIQAGVVGGPHPPAATSRSLAGKIVLLGRASIAADRFPVPGRREESAVSGVYLHAAAAQTLVSGPLIEPTRLGRIAIDIGLSVVIIVVLTWIRLHYESSRREVHEDRLHRILTTFAILGVIGVAFMMVTVTRVMWEDAILVIVVLLVQRPAERFLELASTDGVGAAIKAWRALVFRRSRERDL
jgi:hypothetical protein